MTYILTATETKELSERDVRCMKYSDFDEFVMSSELMHWDNRMMYMHDDVKHKETAVTWA